MAAQGTQDHRISIIQGVSSSRTHPVQPVSLSGMTRTLGGFGQCERKTKNSIKIFDGKKLVTTPVRAAHEPEGFRGLR